MPKQNTSKSKGFDSQAVIAIELGNINGKLEQLMNINATPKQILAAMRKWYLCC
jgi:hypothetical protein